MSLALLVLFLGGAGASVPVAQSASSLVPSQVRDRVLREGRVRILVELRLSHGAHVAEGALSDAGVARQRDDIKAIRRQLLTRLAGRDHRVLHQYDTVPWIALEVASDALAELEASVLWVDHVVEDNPHPPSLPQTVPLIGADRAWSRGFDGAGTVVAILDTGVDTGHPFFAGRIVEEACYSTTTTRSTTLCPNGQDEQVGTGAGANCAFGACWHGTHVAGIAAGNGAGAGVAFSGVAKAAQLMAVQIFSLFNTTQDCGGSPPCVLAWTSDIMAGLEHVYALRTVRNFAAANLSLGGGAFTTACDGDPTKPMIDNLRSVGIATVIAAGNGGSTNSLSSPGCVSSAISVGATSKSDVVSSYTNVSPAMSLFAPGDSVESSVPGALFGFASGTSMATPHVTGAWAVLKQAAPNATVDQILSALQSTGLPISDTRAGGTVTKPRIRVDQALAVLVPAVTVTSVSPASGVPGTTVPVTITGAGFASGATVTFGAGIAITSVVVASSTRLTATLAISATSAAGARNVTITNPNGGSGTLQAGFTVQPSGAAQQVNVAARVNGGVASASSTYSAAYPVSAANDGDRKGANWGNGGGWNDGTQAAFPDWLQVAFNGMKTISEIDVVTLQDNYSAPVEPTEATTFTAYGLTDFEVQYSTAGAWAPVPGGTITGNNRVWRRLTFAAVTTDRIRVLVTGARSSYSRITELEAWGSAAGAPNTPPTVALTAPTDGAVFPLAANITVSASAGDIDGSVAKVEFFQGTTKIGEALSAPYSVTWSSVAAGTYSVTARATDNLGAVTTSTPVTVTVAAVSVNVAAQANGGVVSASSTYSAAYPVSAANDGDRKGASWGNGGGWNDGTQAAFPDWLQVAFNGMKTISEIDVVTLQDNYSAPVEPTATMTFAFYGLTDFQVQYWTGGAWATVPGGTITGNNRVWRRLTFAAVTTDRIRVLVTGALSSYSRIAELEAWGQ